MMELLKGYLDSIDAAATQNFAKGGPLTELAASLAISVDTVARQQQEKERLYKHINTLKKERDSRSQSRDIGRRMTSAEYMHTL